MNKPKTRATRIIDWLRKPKVWLGFALLVIATAIVSTVLSLSPSYEGLSARLLVIAGGFLAAAVLTQTMKRADAAKKALDQKKESNVQKTFSDGITYLGHESESVILGGIHSLLDLAKENNDYRPRVLKILCTHIKTTTAAEEYRKKYPKQPSTTIQILLDSLFKDEEYNIFTVDSAEKNYRADLSGAYLTGSELSGARLQGVTLAGAQMQGANLTEAQLQAADLTRAQLQEADLTRAQFQEALLMDAQLQGANFTEAQLKAAHMISAQLERVEPPLITTKNGPLRRAPTARQGVLSRGDQTEKQWVSLTDGVVVLYDKRGDQTEKQWVSLGKVAKSNHRRRQTTTN